MCFTPRMPTVRTSQALRHESTASKILSVSTVMDLSSATREDPYFDDGNIVLAASTADGAVHLFPIYRGLLSRHSSVFADMFSVSSAPDSDAQEAYEGAPLVWMPDDAKDLGDMLRLLLAPSYVLAFALSGALSEGETFRSIDPSAFDPTMPLVLEGALKLATKYDVPVVRSAIVKHLQCAWPMYLEEWHIQRALIHDIK